MIENAIKNFLLGLVPDFVWDILPYWPFIFWSILGITAIAIGYRVYRLGGWPALTAAVGAAGVALGFWLGRKPSEDVKPQGEPPKPKKTIRKKTMLNDSILKNVFNRKNK